MTDKCLTDGGPVTEDHREINPANGQQKGYVVLTQEERDKGFIRKVRTTYKHLVCNTTTSMNKTIAETYARQPDFYNGTFCVHCGVHAPLTEFVWLDDNTQVGT